MRSVRDQDVATGVISLGLLANKLAWFLSGGPNDSPALKVNETVFEQWKTVLRETIDFMETPERQGPSGRQEVAPRFLSRAQYLEQIYTATPDTNKKDLKTLAKYLEAIYGYLEKLSKKGHLSDAQESSLLAFTRSLANASIQEASRFHHEAHIRRSPETMVEMRQNAQVSSNRP